MEPGAPGGYHGMIVKYGYVPYDTRWLGDWYCHGPL
jgi:hypothetical protein